MTEDEWKLRTVRLEEQILGLREQQKAHALETKEALRDIGAEIKELLATINKGKGAYLGVTIFAAAVGGIAAKMLGAISLFAK